MTSNTSPSGCLRQPDRHGWLNGVKTAVLHVVAAICVECRYRFATRGLAQLATGAALVAPHADSQYLTAADDEILATHLSSLERLDDRDFAAQLDLLELFLAAAKHHGTRVILIEGQYHPDAYTVANRQLHAAAREQLRRLVSRHSTVEYWPVNSDLALNATDYRDGYHVKWEAGLRYVTGVLNRLTRMEAPTRHPPARS